MEVLKRGAQKPNTPLLHRSLTQRQLAYACVILFVFMLIPLIIIALYNYPADDDFGYVLPTATAWVKTHSLAAAMQANVDNTIQVYNTWQGDFTSTFLFALNPMIFNIKLYFLGNWYLLALLCLSAGYLLKSVTNHWLHTSRTVFWIVYTAIMVLVIQFMPHISDSIYWFNGSQYTVAACFLMLTLGLLLRCNQPQSLRRGIMRGVLLAFCGIMLGGSFYGPALGAFVALVLVTLMGFVRKARLRWHSLVTLLFFCVAFAISLSAPGNVIRQARVTTNHNAVYTVIHSILDSFDLTGKWLSPQLFAMLMLIVPVMWVPLRDSKVSFRHPLLITVMLYGMFSATLAPSIYTGFGYELNRYYNIVYLYFLAMALGSTLYAEGALIRWLERRTDSSPSAASLMQLGSRAGIRFSCGYLALCIALLTLGGFANTIMNTPSISAAKSLITGDAAQFHQEMEERQEYIRVTDSDVVAVQTLSVIVPVFKEDKLPFQGIYGRVRYMKWYFELFHQPAQGQAQGET